MLKQIIKNKKLVSWGGEMTPWLRTLPVLSEDHTEYNVKVLIEPFYLCQYNKIGVL